jgi:hypothetical protein
MTDEQKILHRKARNALSAHAEATKRTGTPPGRIDCPPGGIAAIKALDAAKHNLVRTALAEQADRTEFFVDRDAPPLPVAE